MTSQEALEKLSVMQRTLDRVVQSVSSDEPDWERYLNGLLALCVQADAAREKARMEYMNDKSRGA